MFLTCLARKNVKQVSASVSSAAVNLKNNYKFKRFAAFLLGCVTLTAHVKH